MFIPFSLPVGPAGSKVVGPAGSKVNDLPIPRKFGRGKVHSTELGIVFT